jgi:glutamate dehydrogenase (NAD(P)+)
VLPFCPQSSFKEGQALPRDSILVHPVDVLIPAAIGGVITAANAGQLQCKFLVEAANGPTTPEGDAVLKDRGIVVLPDIYTNAGKDGSCRVLHKYCAKVLS